MAKRCWPTDCGAICFAPRTVGHTWKRIPVDTEAMLNDAVRLAERWRRHRRA